MGKWFGLVAAIAALSFTGCDSQQTTDERASELIEWSKRNPDVNEETWRGVQSLVCRPEAKSVCGPNGCAEGEPNVWLEFKPDSRTVRRCDNAGCDEYPAELSYSGSWAIL